MVGGPRALEAAIERGEGGYVSISPKSRVVPLHKAIEIKGATGLPMVQFYTEVDMQGTEHHDVQRSSKGTSGCKRTSRNPKGQ
eukprot:6486028-Amphidinium_carterae.1